MNTSITITLCFIIVSVNGAPHSNTALDSEWITWKLRYGKTYMSAADELQHRLSWETNYKFVTEHNQRPDTTYKVELNTWADQVKTHLVILCVKAWSH